MVFRLPTHLDSFVPPPSQQTPEQRPWRGGLIVSGMRSSDRSSSQTIRVSAVETDGDNRTDLWPSQFFTQIIHRPILKDLQAWVKRHSPPLCTFMPDHHRDPNINTVNQTTFRSLSRILFENQTVAVASWGSDDIPGAGLIIFPAQNSSSLLVGALFFTAPFPSFVGGAVTPPMSITPPQMQIPTYSAQYQQPILPYATSSRHQNSASPRHPLSYPASPIDDPGFENRRAHYRYPVPQIYPTGRTSLLVDPAWTDAKDEENGKYTTFTPTHDTNYPRSG